MRIARGAKAATALGATLIALTLPAFGAQQGGAINGIDAGGISGIDAGGINGIDAGGISGIDAGGISGIDAGDVLAGPVEAIDLANGTFMSLGQVVLAPNQTLGVLRVGDFVTVEGSVMGPGWLYADVVSVADVRYVPGATEVFVTGMLSSIDSAAGKARLGSLTVDYTPSLGRAQAPSSAMWTFRGTQPATNGLMISDISSAFEQ